METALIACPACGKTNRVPVRAAGHPRCGNCKADLPGIVSAGDADFAAVAEQSAVPVLVDFWAAWCGPCRMVSPVLDKLARERPGKIKLVKVDIDANPGLLAEYGISSVPTFKLFKDGEVVKSTTGANPLPAIEADYADYL